MEITFYRKLADKVADAVIENQEYSESEAKRIRYGLVCIFSDLYKFILLLIIFSVFSRTLDFLIAFAAVLLLRPAIAGFHAKSELLCILFSFLTMLISVVIGGLSVIPGFVHLALIIMLPILGAVIAPVRTRKIEEKKIRSKILAFILTAALLLIDYYFLSGQTLLISVIQIYFLALYQLSKNIRNDRILEKFVKN